MRFGLIRDLNSLLNLKAPRDECFYNGWNCDNISIGGRMKTIALPSHGTRQPIMFCQCVMNYKRHNQGYRAHVRREDTSGYWLPKYRRGRRTRCYLKTRVVNIENHYDETTKMEVG